MMRKSLLYNLHSAGQKQGIEVDGNRFKEVFMSKYGKVRIWKVMSVDMESRAWNADPANRICDAPGSWYCVGQYPPALEPIIKKRKNFKQLEDFNTKRSADDDEYNKEYMKRLGGEKSGGGRDGYAEQDKEKKDRKKEKKDAKKDSGKASAGGKKVKWQDTEETSLLWEIVNEGSYDVMTSWIQDEPNVVHLRSADGRGPLWWAYEKGDKEMIKIFKKAGASTDEVDENGLTPAQAASK